MLEWANALKALFLGLIEGITEFLPISSTGHLILVGDWIDFESDEGRVFEIVIQLGAILAVCWLFRHRIITLARGVLTGDPVSLRFAAAVVLAFLPAAVLGVLFIDVIKNVLFNPLVVATTLVLGGLVILWVESRTTTPATIRAEEIHWRQAAGIGLAQCLAMVPGVSRSGATIVGGMLAGASRQAATEFSFFLAIPTMLGASVFDAWRHHELLRQEDLITIAIGFLAAFVSALLVVNALLRFVARHSLRVFAWYRIALGLVVALGFAVGLL